MTEDDFWELTPGMFQALMVRHQRAFYPTACLLAMMRNTAFGMKHDRVFEPEDYMSVRGKGIAGRFSGMSKQAIKQMVSKPLPSSVFRQFAEAHKEQQRWPIN